MNRKPKIIVLGPGYPFRNGQSVFLNALCQRLDDEYEVELINFTLLYPKILFTGSSQFDETQKYKKIFPNKRLLSSVNPWTWYKTAKYINAQEPDLIAIDWWHPFFGVCFRSISTFLTTANRRKLVFITENVISHEAGAADKILTKIGLKKARCFLALSASVKNHLQALFPQQVFRSTLPIYDFYNKDDRQTDREAKAKFGFKKDTTVFLFFGVIRKYKGLDLLIQAFAELYQERKDIGLLIAGDFYGDYKSYADLMKKSHIEEAVHLENRFIPNEEVKHYFKACDAVVLPYRSATQSGVLSMAFGFRKPAVVTDVGELGNLMNSNKTGVVVARAEEKNLAEGLRKFLKLKQENTDFETGIDQHLEEIDEFRKINKVFAEMLHYVEKK